MKIDNKNGITPISSTAKIGDFEEKTVISVYTENGVKMVHYLGYGYCSDGTDNKNYRLLDYTFLEASATDILKCGGLLQWESENQDSCKQYIQDCTEAEIVDIYMHYNNGNAPDGYLDERLFSENTPDGMYIISPAPMEFEMFFDVRFSREITIREDKEDFVFPGGFEMVMNGKHVKFDFEYCDGCPDEKDKTCASFRLYSPDYLSFPDLLGLSESDLQNVTKIIDAYVYTEEDGQNSEDVDVAEVTEIRNIKFLLSDGRKIKIPQNVIKKYNHALSNNNASVFTAWLSM